MAMAGASTATSVASAHFCTLRCPSILSRHQSHAVAASAAVRFHISHLLSTSEARPLMPRCSASSQLFSRYTSVAQFKCGELVGRLGWKDLSLRVPGFSNGKENIGRRVLCTRKFCVSATIAETEISKSSTVDGEKSKFALSVPAFQKRLRIAGVKGGPDEGLGLVGQKMTIRGWVRTCRLQKTFTFIEVNDGSCLSNLQAVVQNDVEGYDAIESGLVTTGASVAIEGELIESQGAKQKVELKATKVTLIGGSDATTFPVQKKKLTREYLRTIAHMRPRTNTFGAVARVRNALAYATHQFFQEKGFVWVASPIITASDCEGAGEQFCVTTLIPNSHLDPTTKISDVPTTKEGVLDWSQDFFGKPAFLTVSGQLNAEIYATSLSDVYTFGPTFRAENSNTSRHLAEFWMIEPELAFADLRDDMACATAYLQHVVRHILDNCREDMDFFDKWVEKGIIARLQSVAEKDFVHITYTDAVELLTKAKKKFEFPVKWGCDLQSEHERYLTEEAFKGSPVIVTDYPKDIKAFYMRENEDGKTVAAMDILVPRVGELIGGSQREERLDRLEARIEELGLNKDSYWWYLDLRRYGTVPHAGFGLGFERLVQFATGIENIRDVIPFPRTPGSAEF
ncbi:hypothetical protein R1flu_001248 [Riccia fluitans]|uniref:asparagine--tRNA ligase n=1 Tax=Riccia fluitans TaxID=41844 RepID=A0ABD1Y2Q7_9MARC